MQPEPRGLPPRFAIWLLDRTLPLDLRDAFIGDLEESYRFDALPNRGSFGAALWFWRQTFYAPLTHLRRRPVPRILQPPIRERSMSLVLSDLAFAWRMLLRRPAFSALAVLTLALGIGATTAIFSAAYPILFQPVPFPDAQRLRMIWERESDGSTSNVGFATFSDIATRNHSFERVAAMASWSPTMTGRDEPERLNGQRVSAAFFRTLGIAPALGRDFAQTEDVRGLPRLAIISHALWRDRFGSDSGVIGRHVTLDDNDFEIVGVLPATFENLLDPSATIYALLRYDSSLPWACRTCRHLRAVGRVRADVSDAQLMEDMSRLSRELVAEHPTDYAAPGFVMPTLRDDVVKSVRPALLAVLGAVVLLLLIACLNATNLLLGRGAQRRAEFAVRNALGASRGRVARQLLVESAMLAMIGGAAGVAVAAAGVRALIALSPANLPRLSAIEINGPVLLFALAATALVSVVFGLVPAAQAARFDIQQSIRESAGAVSTRGTRTRAGLVVAETALALVLLVSSGLLLRSMVRLLAIDPGFDADHVLTMQVQAGTGALTNDTLVRAYFDQALAAVRARPGVVAAALTSQLPLSGDFDGNGVHVQSRPNPNPSNDPTAFRYGVSDGYFETMRIPLVEGRYLTAADRDNSPPVVVINRAFAARHFPNGKALGERVRVGAHDTGPWREIVGIVGDVKHVSLSAEPSDAVYLPESQWAYADNAMTVVVRANGDAAAIAPDLRKTVRAVNADQPIVRVATASQLIAETAAQRRFALLLFESFATIALVLAATGIYGVLAGSVTERLRELGVRAALGATGRDLVRMILRQGMTLAGIGVGLGLAGAAAGSRFIADLLFDVRPMDAITYASVTVTLLCVSLAACWLPARRAGRVDPIRVLRAE